MEKLSLYDLLSFLLPGAVAATLLYFGFLENQHFDFSKINDQLASVIFIAVSFFIGSIIHFAFDIKPFKVLIRILGLYEKIPDIYYQNKIELKSYVKETFIEDLKQFEKYGIKDDSNKIEHLWSKIYYKLEAEEKITTPKSFQSFYFFFRNIASICIITIVVAAIMVIIKGISDTRIITLVIAFIVLVLSILAGRMHRRKMVDRMFWTYYSLYKNK